MDLLALHKGFEVSYNVRKLFPHVVFSFRDTLVFNFCSWHILRMLFHINVQILLGLKCEVTLPVSHPAS